jgi:hypothetical protein
MYRGDRTIIKEAPVAMTSIGFGGGEVIEVGLPLDEVRSLLQNALAQRELLELEGLDGETLIINPEQVKVLQNSGVPEPFQPVPESGSAS